MSISQRQLEMERYYIREMFQSSFRLLYRINVVVSSDQDGPHQRRFHRRNLHHHFRGRSGHHLPENLRISGGQGAILFPAQVRRRPVRHLPESAREQVASALRPRLLLPVSS